MSSLRGTSGNGFKEELPEDGDEDLIDIDDADLNDDDEDEWGDKKPAAVGGSAEPTSAGRTAPSEAGSTGRQPSVTGSTAGTARVSRQASVAHTAQVSRQSSVAGSVAFSDADILPASDAAPDAAQNAVSRQPSSLPAARSVQPSESGAALASRQPSAVNANTPSANTASRQTSMAGTEPLPPSGSGKAPSMKDTMASREPSVASSVAPSVAGTADPIGRDAGMVGGPQGTAAGSRAASMAGTPAGTAPVSRQASKALSSAADAAADEGAWNSNMDGMGSASEDRPYSLFGNPAAKSPLASRQPSGLGGNSRQPSTAGMGSTAAASEGDTATAPPEAEPSASAGSVDFGDAGSQASTPKIKPVMAPSQQPSTAGSGIAPADDTTASQPVSRQPSITASMKSADGALSQADDKAISDQGAAGSPDAAPARNLLEPATAGAPTATAGAPTATAAVAAAARLARSKGFAVPAPSAEETAKAVIAAAQTDVNPGVSLSVLQALVEKIRAEGYDPDTMTSREMASKLNLVPFSDGPPKSYVDLLEEGDFGPPDFYISHAMGVPFSNVVELIVNYAALMLPDREAGSTYVWVDMLCRKSTGAGGQSPTPAEVIQDIRAAIASSSGPTLLCLDGSGSMLDIAWVQYEAWCTASIKGGAGLRVLCAEVLNPGHVVGVLAKVNPAAARCLHPDHVTAIVDELRNQGALDSFQPALCQILLQAANAEAQELAGMGDGVVEAYLASALHKCGVFARACGIVENAEALHAEASALMAKALGDEDGLTAASSLGLAEILLVEKKWPEAEAKYRTALKMQVKAQGENHTDSLRAARQLALVLKRQGKFDEAGTLYRQLLASYETLYGAQSANYAAGLLQLAVLLGKRRKDNTSLVEAGQLAVKALAINDEELGTTHKTTLENIQLLKELSKKTGDREAWQQYYTVLRERMGKA